MLARANRRSHLVPLLITTLEEYHEHPQNRNCPFQRSGCRGVDPNGLHAGFHADHRSDDGPDHSPGDRSPGDRSP
ncbi:MAG: hypothetical protein HW418_3878, partial [Anaerolineales bacterium]|nr:hypothetical protein [Anaerolineales bacterium]